MSTKTYDAVVIGSGPGGYVAGIKLGQLGLKAVVVERESSVGGVCLNWGCIPSKALIAAANIVERGKHASAIGIDFGKPTVDVGKLQEWKNGIVKKLNTGVRGLLRGNGVETLEGTAKLASPSRVEVTTKDGPVTLEATKGIIVATGARVIQIPGFEPDGKVIITAKEAVSLPRVPEHLVVIGGGVIGLELGIVYQKLGAKLTVVEMMDQLLPGTDTDLVAVLEKKIKAGGASILLKAKAKECKIAEGRATVYVEHEGTTKMLSCDNVLVAVGFKPNSREIGLEALGVKLDERGFVATDEQGRTNVPSIFAIGDVAASPFLAHKASKEGEIAAEAIAGQRTAKDWRGMPAAIFTDPEIASVGLSETEAKKRGVDYKIGKFPFSALGRAMAVMETDGFVKVVIDAKSHEVLGVHIVGPEASDLIAEAALAVEMCAFAEDVGLTVHAHPTLAEAMMEAANAAVGHAIHMINRKH
ncbi:MAG: dihydrolipoyl dehydrogenase [Deltaproteobacteria bacterium]|nr:dihydrolipoyl dehydrogenase [Deltaproteobacteria bacterium]